MQVGMIMPKYRNSPGLSQDVSITWDQGRAFGCSSHATVECFRCHWQLMFTLMSRLLMNLPLHRANWYSFSRKTHWVQGENKTHTSYITRIGFNIITCLINHIQFLFCYFAVLRRRYSAHKTGWVNKWLQIMQSINSRGTCKYQAVRSKWNPLVCSDQSLWIPPT